MTAAKPVRLQLHRTKGFDLQAASMATNGLAAINVARPSKWGNPFVVGRDGTRTECVRLYTLLMGGLLCLSCEADPEAQRKALKYADRNLEKLRGKNLACHCPLDAKPCHADVLLELANGRKPAHLIPRTVG